MHTTLIYVIISISAFFQLGLLIGSHYGSKDALSEFRYRVRESKKNKKLRNKK